jgi:hypothetical protein
MGTETRKVGLLVVALCLGLATLGWAAPPTAELAPPTVVVHNSAGAAGEGLVGLVTETLTTQAQAMPQVRASVAQPWALEADIASASLSRGKAEVRLVAELTPPAGGLRYQAEAVGEAPSATEAAGKAARQAMEDLGVCVNAKGSIYYYDDRKLEAWITIGSNEGLRLRAKVAFLRAGEKVGEGRVITVKDVDAIVRVDRKVPGGNVLVGDDVTVTRNGPRWAVDAQVAHERRERNAGTFLAAAVLWGLILVAR